MLDFSPNYTIARVGLHHFEEPPVSANNGSGTIFFSGCSLKCLFCQNYEISRGNKGVTVSEDTLIKCMLYLQSQGAENINLVTPSHYIKALPHTLVRAKRYLTIPVVYNTSSYESKLDLKQLEGLVDVYLPDLKYYSDDLAQTYSHAPHYFQTATQAIEEMYRQQPRNVFDADNRIVKGMIVRHLVLPSHVEDSKQILDYLYSLSPDLTVSLMGQYFPPTDNLPPPLNRRLTVHEYASACQYMENLGIHNGFTQELSSATSEYLPDFHIDLLKKQLETIENSFPDLG